MSNDKRKQLMELEELRRKIPHVTASGLSATIKQLKKSGLPDLDTRQNFRDARDLWASEINTPYGPISIEKGVPRLGGGNLVKLRNASPLAMLWMLYAACIPFAAFMDRCMEEYPPSADAP